MTTNKQLRELAEKATPGPWGWDGPVWGYDVENEAPWLIQEQGSGVVITGELQCSEANAEYIAVASPEVITALLDENEALQAECELLRKHLQNLIDQTTPLEPVPGNPMWSRRIQLDEVLAERDQLQAECEKLRKDAEATRKSVKLLNYLFARNIIAMQSAVIEWEKGKGAAAGMQWIWNTLFGPGQIPDEEETDAQAYFDREIEPLDAAMEPPK